MNWEMVALFGCSSIIVWEIRRLGKNLEARDNKLSSELTRARMDISEIRDWVIKTAGEITEADHDQIQRLAITRHEAWGFEDEAEKMREHRCEADRLQKELDDHLKKKK